MSKAMTITLAGFLIAAVAIAVVVIKFVTHVDAGHVGVEIHSCSEGGVQDTPVGVGYHLTGPCTSIVQFPTYQQTLVLTRSPHEGNPRDESITVTSSEGLPINVDVSVSFTVDPAKAPHIYKKFRLSLDHIKQVYMRQTAREALQETFAKYTAQQLYSDKRESSRGEVQAILTTKFAPDGFVVTQFTINETRIPPEVDQAIRAKVAMAQEAQRAEQAVKKAEAEGKQRVAQVRAEAAATQVLAEGKAAARKSQADAEAYANKKISESLSPALVEYLRVQRWNGTLPQVTGGGTVPMLNLSK
jgi:regulator of protease activity HflC (stomatin/prohibitin superfamily)